MTTTHPPTARLRLRPPAAFVACRRSRVRAIERRCDSSRRHDARVRAGARDTRIRRAATRERHRYGGRHPMPDMPSGDDAGRHGLDLDARPPTGRIRRDASRAAGATARIRLGLFPRPRGRAHAPRRRDPGAPGTMTVRIMGTIAHRGRPLASGVMIALTAVAPALADDTEVFLGQASARGSRPNILFIVDTSGSMGSLVRVPSRPTSRTSTTPADAPTRGSTSSAQQVVRRHRPASRRYRSPLATTPAPRLPPPSPAAPDCGPESSFNGTKGASAGGRCAMARPTRRVRGRRRLARRRLLVGASLGAQR